METHDSGIRNSLLHIRRYRSIIPTYLVGLTHLPPHACRRSSIYCLVLSNYTEKDIPSLNSSNVVNVLCKVKAETRWSYTAMWILQIPTSKLNEMGRAPGCNEEKLLQAVSLWLKSCPYASWRWLIWYLDEYGENELVDEISGYAEPLRGIATQCAYIYTYVRVHA